MDANNSFRWRMLWGAFFLFVAQLILGLWVIDKPYGYTVFGVAEALIGVALAAFAVPVLLRFWFNLSHREEPASRAMIFDQTLLIILVALVLCQAFANAVSFIHLK